MAKLIKWEVAPALTGRYRSYRERGWPSAFYRTSNDPAVYLAANQEYSAKLARFGSDDLEIRVRVAFWKSGSTPGSRTFDWRSLKRRATTLAEAKEIAERFIEENLEKIYPPELRCEEKEKADAHS